MTRDEKTATAASTPAEPQRSPSRLRQSVEGARETLVSLALAVCFMMLYVAVFTIDRQLFARDIIFYNALSCLSLVAGGLFVLWLLGALERFSGPSTPSRIPVAILLFLFIGYAFAITVPALIKRSGSFFMIANVVESGPAGVTGEELEERFVDGYVYENAAIPRRLQEQVVTGNFEPVGDRYVVTERGMMVYRIHQGFLAAFRTDERFRSADRPE